MSPKKLYFLGFVGGLAIVGIVIAVVQFTQNESAETSTETISIDQEKFASWQTIEPVSQLISAKFPTAPIRQENTIPVADSDLSILQETHTAQDATGNSYFIGTLVYPENLDPAVSQEILQTALEGMVASGEGNTLVDSTYDTFKGMPAVEFRIQNGNVNYQGKMFYSGRVMYQAFVAFEEGSLANDEYVYFLSSLTPKTQ